MSKREKSLSVEKLKRRRGRKKREREKGRKKNKKPGKGQRKFPQTPINW